MIDRLAVKDFQSLADVDLALGPLTVLVGASNSGKSAVRRAMEGLLRNDAAGGRVRSGTKELKVGIYSTDENAFVVWTKGEKVNRYELSNGEGLGTIDKPGSTIPERAAELLRIDPALSFTSQFDSPYLLAETPSSVARTLGDLTNISVLYDGIREASRRKGAAAKEAKTHEEQAAVTAEQLTTYADLPAEVERLQAANVAITEAANAEALWTLTYQAAAEAHSTELALMAGREAAANMPDLEAAAQHLELAEAHLRDASGWDYAYAAAQSAQAALETASMELSYLADLPSLTAAGLAVELYEATLRAYASALQHQEGRSAAVRALTTAATEVATNLAAIATEFPSCPMCGTALKDDAC